MITLGLVVSVLVNVAFILGLIIKATEMPDQETIRYNDSGYNDKGAVEQLAKWHAVVVAQGKGLQRQARHIKRLKTKLLQYL